MPNTFRDKMSNIFDSLKTSTTRTFIEERPAVTSSNNLLCSYRFNALAKYIQPSNQPLRVIEINTLSAGATSIVFEGIENTPLAQFSPGNYITLRVPIDGSIVYRPYSIASSPSLTTLKNQYVVVVKSSGLMSDYLTKKLEVGDTLTASLPCGEFNYIPNRDCTSLVGVASGSGITPFLSMASAIDDEIVNYTLSLFYCCRSLADVLPLSELGVKESAKLKIIYLLSEEDVDGSEYGKLTQKLLSSYQKSQYSLFACGNSLLYEYLTSQFNLK